MEVDAWQWVISFLVIALWDGLEDTAKLKVLQQLILSYATQPI